VLTPGLNALSPLDSGLTGRGRGYTALVQTGRMADRTDREHT
jgi:hypothetical protein